jgi:hypothetical protein
MTSEQITRCCGTCASYLTEWSHPMSLFIPRCSHPKTQRTKVIYTDGACEWWTPAPATGKDGE